MGNSLVDHIFVLAKQNNLPIGKQFAQHRLGVEIFKG